MKNFRKINKKEAADFYNKALFKTFFHSLGWQEFLEKEFKWLKFEYYLYKDELLFAFAKVDNKLISLPFCEYGGPLPLKNDVDLDNFIRDTLLEFKNIKIKFHPAILRFSEVEFSEVEPPIIIGGSTSETSETTSAASAVSTHWIENLNRTTEQDLFASFRKTLRHSIKNAENQGLETKKCLNLKELKQFYNLYLINLKRKKTVPYPFSIFEFLFNNPSAEILLALFKDKIIAGDLFVHYDKFIHYLFSASDYKYRNLGSSYLILWKKIKSLCGQDKIFDLGAAPKNSELEIFKKGWRGKEYPILQIGIKRSEESLRSSKLRKIWGLLPNFVVRKLSPFLIKYRL